jgi:cytochrome c peroxidase
VAPAKPDGSGPPGTVIAMRTLLAGFLVGAICFAADRVPLGLDLYMPIPVQNPLTPEKIALGRRLFFDRRLSADLSISCSTCHDPDRAYSDGRPRSAGVLGRIGRRNSPALVNRGYGRLFFWDGRSASLEEQVLKPIEDVDEMNLPLAEAAKRIDLSPEEISRALASFIRSILSGNSRFDRSSTGTAPRFRLRSRLVFASFKERATASPAMSARTSRTKSFTIQGSHGGRVT